MLLLKGNSLIFLTEASHLYMIQYVVQDSQTVVLHDGRAELIRKPLVKMTVKAPNAAETCEFHISKLPFQNIN